MHANKEKQKFKYQNNQGDDNHKGITVFLA